MKPDNNIIGLFAREGYERHDTYIDDGCLCEHSEQMNCPGGERCSYNQGRACKKPVPVSPLLKGIFIAIACGLCAIGIVAFTSQQVAG